MRKRELQARYERLKAENERLRELLDDIKIAQEHGCNRGEWCGACKNFYIRQIPPFYGSGVCSINRCDHFKPKVPAEE